MQLLKHKNINLGNSLKPKKSSISPWEMIQNQQITNFFCKPVMIPEQEINILIDSPILFWNNNFVTHLFSHFSVFRVQTTFVLW